MNRLLLLPALALLAAALLGPPALAAKPKVAEVGKPAPGFALESVTDGKVHKLEDYRGKTVVITFHSINCPWYKMRRGGGYDRHLGPLAEKYEGKDVVLIGINSNDNESSEHVARYLKKHEISYPVVKDPGNKIADAYGARTTPHFYVIDGKGIVRYIGGFEKAPVSPEKCGEMDEPYLVPAIEALRAGEQVAVKTSRSIGCTIKRVRK